MEFKMKYCPFCGGTEFIIDDREVNCKKCDGWLSDIKNGEIEYDIEITEIYCHREGITVAEFFNTINETPKSELLPVEINENQEQTVSARKLHDFLQSKERFSKWFEKVLEYDFAENIDYTPYQMVHPQNNQELIDYKLKIDMAKEASMVSKLPMGKVARQYFIQLEKDWNSPEKTMARALLMADKKIKQLSVVNEQQSKKIEIDKPKVLFAESVEGSKTSVLIGELAKIICQNGVKIGRDRLFEWLREHGYLEKRGENRNIPTQKYIEMGLFEVKKSTINNPDGSIRTTRTTKVTGKGQIYFVNKFLNNSQKVGA